MYGNNIFWTLLIAAVIVYSVTVATSNNCGDNNNCGCGCGC